MSQCWWVRSSRASSGSVLGRKSSATPVRWRFCAAVSWMPRRGCTPSNRSAQHKEHRNISDAKVIPPVRGHRDHAGMSTGGNEMAQKRLGIVISAPDSSAVMTTIANLEQRGIPAAWLTSAGAGGADPLGALAAAALRTQHMLLGTAITQTFPRHPIAVVQQVQVLAQLAPGRFRWGLGTSGRAGMEQTYGVNFRAPLGHLREYLRIVKT